MKVGLLTDAPKHNLALMKISTFHRAKGDEITLNEPLGCDLTYGSWLYKRLYDTTHYGGPACDPKLRINGEISKQKPDYSLFNIDYSLGFTWEHCPRQCGFCVVPKQDNPKEHRSIWDFHDERFSKICLLNNNTFSDPQWLNTFEEIWEANLIVHDESGYDLRLLTDEKAEALNRTQFEKGYVHFAWDFVEDEADIMRGLAIAKKHAVKAMIYVLIGYNTTREQDIYRCQKVHQLGYDPYPMPYNGGTRQDKAFKRFICLRYYRKYELIEKAWSDYK